MSEAAEPLAPINPSLAVRLFRPLGRLWLRANGWRIEGEMPNLPKFIIVGAPHTSNWDLPYTLAAGLHYGVRVHWMGKDSIFKWPYGGLMHWLGGIPVDRSKPNNAVAQMVEKFAASDRLVVVIPPEGTRGKITRWKTGFYHIAVGAGYRWPSVFSTTNAGPPASPGYTTRPAISKPTWPRSRRSMPP